MDDRVVRLESAVEQLQRAVQSLQAQVDSLEGRRPPLEVPGAHAAENSTLRSLLGVHAGAAAPQNPRDPIVALSLIGRLFLVLAGGFFLRAMTEAGVLAAPVGIGLAFLYALVWLVLGYRSSRLGQPTSALFHAVGAAMVAFPLLVEATTRFKVLGVAASVLVLVLLTAAFLFVAVRQRLHAVAWITVVAALPTSLVLALKTRHACAVCALPDRLRRRDPVAGVRLRVDRHPLARGAGRRPRGRGHDDAHARPGPA